MKRRNVLLGLGTAAAGSGMVFGSGAFTQVEATRDIGIDLEDDVDAGVELQAGKADGGGFVDISNSGGDTISINLNKEEINSKATLTVGDTSITEVDTDNIGSSSGDNVAFGIIDSTDDLTTADSTDAKNSLGITVDVDSGSAKELTVDFFGDSDDSNLDESVDVSGEADTDFSSTKRTADSSSTAKFLLNAAATNVSESAAGQIKLKTGSNTGTTDGSITVTAELVDANTEDYSSVGTGG